MKKNLLRYLSVITLGLILISCEDDDKITDDLPPQDGVNFSFKPLELNQTVDENGNTFVSSGTLLVDADVAAAAPEGFSKDVLIQIVKWEDGEEIEITKGAQFNLSGSGAGDAKSFNLNFNDIVERQTELNLSANLLEAGSMRKIKGVGILVNVEPDEEDSQVPYKIKSIVWSSDVDINNDGFYASRDVSFTVATEGTVEKELTGNIYLISDSELTSWDTVLIHETGQFTVRREGFADNNLSFSINNADTLIRAGYEILMRFSEIENPDVVVYEEFFKAADFVRIGFEPVLYDNREYFFPAQPSFTWDNQSPAGYFDVLHVNFDIQANADLDYVDLEDVEDEFGLRAPYVSIYYKNLNDPAFTNFAKLGDTILSEDPFEAQRLGFFITDLLPRDSTEYDFEIHIKEPVENYFGQTEDISVDTLTKDDYPTLGNVKIDNR